MQTMQTMQTMQIISLYDVTGFMGAPWARAGATSYAYDYATTQGRQERIGNGVQVWGHFDGRVREHIEAIVSHHLEIERRGGGAVRMVFGFPPCTDLAVSGAGAFARKERQRPGFQLAALALVQSVVEIADRLNAPWMIENPVSVLSSLWRQPDRIFHPFEFSGYLSADDEHPLYSDVIPARDLYRKRTCIWHSRSGFVFPSIRMADEAGKDGEAIEPVAPQFARMTSESKRSKSVRSATPRGFAEAVWQANRWERIEGRG